MRVLLIQAVSTTSGGECVYPLGLARLASVLREDHELRGLDLNLDPFPWPRVLTALNEFSPQVVCISFRNLDPLAGSLVSFVPQLKALAVLLKQQTPKIPLIVGGSGFSLFAERLMSEVPEIDYGLTGEAEESLPSLLGKLDSPGVVPGTVYRKVGDIRSNDACHIADLTSLLEPDYGLFPAGDYRERNQYVTFMGIESKRGCPHRCSYCLYPSLQGNSVRLLPPEMVVDHLERLHYEQKVDAVHFTDPVLNQPAAHLRAICQGIMARGLNLGWTGFFREDCLEAKDLELYQKAGLSALYFSADGASDHTLGLLNKGMALEQVEQATQMAAASGIVSVYHFLVNLPGESPESVEQTWKLVEHILSWHDKADNPAAMVFNNLRLYPGAPLTDRIMQAGLMDLRTDLLYPVYFNPPPYDGLRHELTAQSIRPEHLGLAAPLEGREAQCGL